MAGIWICVGALAVYAAFEPWHENCREKLTPGGSRLGVGGPSRADARGDIERRS